MWLRTFPGGCRTFQDGRWLLPFRAMRNLQRGWDVARARSFGHSGLADAWPAGLAILAPQLHGVFKHRVAGKFSIEVIKPLSSRSIRFLLLPQAGNLLFKGRDSLFQFG